MLTLQQFLLGKIAEECVEIAQRALKSQQFGETETQPGHTKNNTERLEDEITDLFAILDMAHDAGLITFNFGGRWKQLEEKKNKVWKYHAYSVQIGQVKPLETIE